MLILGFEDIFRVAAKAVLALVIKRIPDTLHFVYAKKHHNLHFAHSAKLRAGQAQGERIKNNVGITSAYVRGTGSNFPVRGEPSLP